MEETKHNNIELFYKWYNFYESRNIKIGPINEAVIELFEDVHDIKLSEQIKRIILTDNSQILQSLG